MTQTPQSGSNRIVAGIWICAFAGILVLVGAAYVIFQNVGTPEEAPLEFADEGLRIEIPLSGGEFGAEPELMALSDLENQLEEALAESGAGELDGNEIGDGKYTIFCYGASAEEMLEVAQPILESVELPEGSAAILPGGFSGFVHQRVPL